MSFCSKCGAFLPEGANVCPNCGVPVNGTTLKTKSSSNNTMAIIAVVGGVVVIVALYFLFMKDKATDKDLEREAIEEAASMKAKMELMEEEMDELKREASQDKEEIAEAMASLKNQRDARSVAANGMKSASGKFLPYTKHYSFSGQIGEDYNSWLFLNNGVGSYFFQQIERFVKVSYHDAKSGRLFLDAYFAENGQYFGSFEGTYSNGKYSGIFKNYKNGGKVNFNLVLD